MLTRLRHLPLHLILRVLLTISAVSNPERGTPGFDFQEISVGVIAIGPKCSVSPRRKLARAASSMGGSTLARMMLAASLICWKWEVILTRVPSLDMTVNLICGRFEDLIAAAIAIPIIPKWAPTFTGISTYLVSTTWAHGI